MAGNDTVEVPEHHQESRTFRGTRRFQPLRRLGAGGMGEVYEVLVATGHGLDAAEAFLAAIPGAQAAEILDLQRRAAEQFLFSGHVDRGLAALGAVLPAIGMRLPARPFGSLVSLLRARARLRLFGLGFRERDPSQVAADELHRVDLCWSVAMSMCMIDHIRGADFQTRALILALRTGEPFRITRALTTEMAYAAIDGRNGIRRSAPKRSCADSTSPTPRLARYGVPDSSRLFLRFRAPRGSHMAARAAPETVLVETRRHRRTALRNRRRIPSVFSRTRVIQNARSSLSAADTRHIFMSGSCGGTTRDHGERVVGLGARPEQRRLPEAAVSDS